MEKQRRPHWGILGGLGPLASTCFLQTIYGVAANRPEQELPIVYLISDPSIPDRTTYLLTRESHILLNILTARLKSLLLLDIDHLVVCCMTMHAVIPGLELDLRRQLISLVDVLMHDVKQYNQRALMLSSTGSRVARLFESHPLWPDVNNRIVMPNQHDQQLIHKLIYEIKMQAPTEDHKTFLLNLLNRYSVDAFIAGCTEIHVLAQNLKTMHEPSRPIPYLDPLMTIAQQIAEVPVELVQYIHI